MNAATIVMADFERTFLGGPAQLLAEVGGAPILRRTLERAGRIAGPKARCIVVQNAHLERAQRLITDWGLADHWSVVVDETWTRPRRELIRSARKWSLDGWRGGLLGATWFDEFLDAPMIARALDRLGCDTALCLDAYMPLLDPALGSAMLAHAGEYREETKLVFTQAPPGLAGVVLRRALVQELIELNLPLGVLLAYRPETPRGDMINQPACLSVESEITHAAARFTGDTRRARELLAAALADVGEDATAAALCAWHNARLVDSVESFPIEVEIELTTDDPLPDTILRPRGARVPRRELRDMAAVSRWCAELSVYDDRLVVLGGHGDPLRHPGFADALAAVRSAGVYGLAVVTPLVDLSDAQLDALLTHKVDVLQVRLDADSRETYRQLHGVDAYDQVIANVERIEAARRQRQSPQPLLACSLVRCAATLAEMESFYDRWIRATGWAVIEGYNEYCGTLPADTLLPTEPPVREACRRLRSRLTLLADGSAAACGQDFAGRLPVGRWDSETLSDIWKGAALIGLRAAQASLDVRNMPLCSCCREWFRP